MARISWDTITTLTTPGLTGTYKVLYYAEVSCNGNYAMIPCVKLYNNTDSTELCYSMVIPVTTANTTEYVATSGFAYVIFTGSAKTFYLNLKEKSESSSSVDMRRATIEIYRVE